MNDPSAALQKAIVAHLKADALVTTVLAQRVYDRVPVPPIWPYASIGPAQALEDDADCVEAFEVFQQVDVWSEDPGFLEAKEIAGMVRKALHGAELALDGFVLNEIRVRNIRYLRAPDGLTSHAVIDIRALLETEQP